MLDATAPAARTPWHLWAIGLVSLFWSGMGAFDYVMTQMEDTVYLAAFTPEQRAYFTGFPTWVVACWALSVWGGVLGALLLLARSRFAVPLLWLSLLTMVATSVHTFALTDGIGIMGVGAAIFSGAIFVYAILVLVYARAMERAGVLS